MNILITGAAGNLGSLLSKHIKDNEKDLNLILMQHQKKVPSDFKDIGRVSYYGDTSRFRSELLPLLKYSNIYEGVNEMTV